MGNTPIEEWTKSPLLRKIRSPNQNKHMIKEQSNNQTDNLSHTNTVTFFHLIWVENKKEESSQLRLKQKNPISWKPDNWEKWDPLDFCDLKMMWKTPMPDFNWWIFFFFFSSSLGLYDWVEDTFVAFIDDSFSFSLYFFLSLIPESYWVCSKRGHCYHHFTSEDSEVQEVNLFKVTGVINDTLELEFAWLNLFFRSTCSILFVFFQLFFFLSNHVFLEYRLVGNLVTS